MEMQQSRSVVLVPLWLDIGLLFHRLMSDLITWGVCVSPTATLKKLDEIAVDHDKIVMKWKSDIELALQDHDRGIRY